MLDNHLIDQALFRAVRKIAADGHGQRIGLAADIGDAAADGDPDAVLMQAARYQGVVHAADFRREKPFRRNDFHRCSGLGAELCGGQAWIGTVVVIDQHIFAGLDVARQYVPGGRHQIGAAAQNVDIWQAAGGNHHHIGVFSKHVRGLGIAAKMQRHVVMPDFRQPPIDDADQVASLPCPRRQQNLPARRLPRLEHHHLVAALARHPRRLKPCGSGPHHHDLAQGCGAGDHMRHGRLAARRGIVDAQGLLALIDPVEAISRPDARADAVFLPGQHFAHDMGLGQMGAGHADHVKLA